MPEPTRRDDLQPRPGESIRLRTGRTSHISFKVLPVRVDWEAGQGRPVEPARNARFYLRRPGESAFSFCRSDAEGLLWQVPDGLADSKRREACTLGQNEQRPLEIAYAWDPWDLDERQLLERDFPADIVRRRAIPSNDGGLRIEVPRPEQAEFDYVVIGSGAGGAPLAANLARAGHKVLVLEAGGDRGHENIYQVPAFHAKSTEDPDMRWDFFVRHYENESLQLRDTKYTKEQRGVLYPRAGTLGGCTAHNAMITVYPHDSDWDRIARLTGDASWNGQAMRRYFERLERCRHRKRKTAETSRHGFDGWLETTTADVSLALRDLRLVKVLVGALHEAVEERTFNPIRELRKNLDPNDAALQAKDDEGPRMIPLAVTEKKRRNGPREFLLDVQRQHPERVRIQTHTLATRLLLDEQLRAVGVKVLEGAHAYRADPQAGSSGNLRKRRVLARREVIVCGGAFNSPQLLKLSGLGPKAELERLGITVRRDMPGVGENLQDRYEVGVVTEMTKDWKLLKGLRWQVPPPGVVPEGDDAFSEWLEGKGTYATNGTVIAIVKRSKPDLPDPDLFIFGAPSYFKGYFPGYSQEVERRKNCFTWAVLKAHTENRAGSVTLRSKDPRDRPHINFRYFEEGNDSTGHDLEAVASGVDFARGIAEHYKGMVRRELVPGPAVASREQVKQFIRDEAWGHHASCTCPIGTESDPMAVLDSDFRVRGSQGLRVVDASVFPRIPGFFIVSAVYMISEKASDSILASARATARDA